MKMAVMRVHKTGNYTVMSNYHFKEKEMSLKAKGLLSLMLSLPENWDYSINGLASLSKDGRDSVMGALQELEKFGYLIRTRVTDDKGKFRGYDYDIYEEPTLTKEDESELKEIFGDDILPRSEKPNTETPYTENPNTENPQQLNTNKINPVGINSLKDKGKIDKEDKRADAHSAINIGKPNSFVKELIKSKYIEKDDLFLSVYNQLFVDLVNDYSFEQVRSCLWYFIKRLDNGKAYDVDGIEIENKFSYLKASLNNGLAKINTDYDPFGEEAIKKTLELLGKE